ncbi:MAG: AI-2E family transporter [Hymenobacteraceae bacterium]|nr:AI-2E family transporter [Hymenobacteraceae bacterium]
MEKPFPAYARHSLQLLGLTLLVIALRRLDGVLLPILFSALFAFLLVPITRRLEGWKWPRWLAILVSILLLAGVLTGIIWVLTAQLMDFTREWDHIQSRLLMQYEVLRSSVAQHFKIKLPNKGALLEQSLAGLRKSGTSIANSAASTTSNVLEVLSLVPIYIFCFLYYRDHFRQFIYRLTRDAGQRSTMMTVVHKIEEVTQNYLLGLLTVIFIVALLNISGLLLLDVKYAVFFGAFASILTIIPFIGMLIGATLPAIYTLVETGSVWQALGVVGVFLFVQFLEGNFITPTITGSKVSINALAAIGGLILGGELWGLPGMILSIPLVAVLKVVFDATPGMEPYGFLLGDVNDDLTKPHGPKGAAVATSWWGRIVQAIRKPKL